MLGGRQRSLELARPAPGFHRGEVGEVTEGAAHLVVGALGVKVADAGGRSTTFGPVPVQPNPSHWSVGGAGGEELVLHLVVVWIEWVVCKTVLVENPVAKLGPLLDEQFCGAASLGDSSVPVGEE